MFKKGLKVNADKCMRSKIRVDGARLEQVSEFKYLGCFGWIRYRLFKVGRLRAGGKLQELWGPWLMHESLVVPVCCMAMRQ